MPVDILPRPKSWGKKHKVNSPQGILSSINFLSLHKGGCYTKICYIIPPAQPPKSNQNKECEYHQLMKKHIVKTFFFFPKSTNSMVFILDGSSEINTHVRRNLWYLICFKHLIVSRVVTNLFFLSPKSLFPSKHAHHVLSYHLIQVPWPRHWLKDDRYKYVLYVFVLFSSLPPWI